MWSMKVLLKFPIKVYALKLKIFQFKRFKFFLNRLSTYDKTDDTLIYHGIKLLFFPRFPTDSSVSFALYLHI